MAQPETGQPEAPATAENPADAFEAIAAEMLGEEEEQPAETETDEGEQPEAETDEGAEDEPEIEAEDDDLPPIDPPVSWDAEAKAKFAEMPRELQEVVQKREADRERFVQSKAQEAARARQEVEQAAIQQLAEVERGYAQHFQSLAEQLQPQRPNPAMLQHDPQTFYAMQAEYEAKVAQQRELQQRSQEFAQQAQQREQVAEQQRMAGEAKVISEHFPEYLDPTMGPKLQQELSAVARELGYPPELIAEARATDIIAMKKVADLKAKADKYDALQAKKMEKVRAAKGLPRVATPGTPQGARQIKATALNNAIASLKETGSVDAAAAAFKAIM